MLPASAPPAGGAGQIDRQGLANLIRHWVHFDTTLDELNRQVREARQQRNAFESQILTALRASNLTNPVIQIGGGRLIVGQDRYQPPLSFRALEGYLDEYYALKPGARSETKEILKFVRSKRQTTVTPCLKRQHTPSTPRVKDKDT